MKPLWNNVVPNDNTKYTQPFGYIQILYPLRHTSNGCNYRFLTIPTDNPLHAPIDDR